MKIITIQIGNSDNKLSQAKWAHYVQAIKLIVANFAYDTYFLGGSSTWEQWQNMCWVIAPLNDDLQEFKEALVNVRQNFNQESMAFTVGETIFL
jgi:hypothetical protein